MHHYLEDPEFDELVVVDVGARMVLGPYVINDLGTGVLRGGMISVFPKSVLKVLNLSEL
jgi:hypothetical protein